MLVRSAAEGRRARAGGVRLARRARPRRPPPQSTRRSANLLEEAGAEVIVAASEAGQPGRDLRLRPMLVGADGAVLLRPGKEWTPGRAGRRSRSTWSAPACPSSTRLDAPACAEGGDTLWLDELHAPRRLGLPHERAGVEALREAFPGVEVITFDLPCWNGRGEVMHLMSLISPLDRRPRARVPAARVRPALSSCSWTAASRWSRFPDEEFETMGG